MKELCEILKLWERRRDEPLALATLVSARGSSYRRPGARMLICGDRTAAGSLSGGCLEDEVADVAQQVMSTGLSLLMEFDTRRRFGCHGRIQILVERAPAEFLRSLGQHLQQRRSCRALTVFEGDPDELGTRMLLPDEESGDGFIQSIEPPIQLLVFGEGPDTQPLRAFAQLLGWTVREFAHASELPLVTDQRTAAVVKSHNYGRDCAALRQLLQLPLRYVGLLGPRRRRDELLGDLLDSGVALSANLFGPAGFELGADTPEEIALSIVAEIQSVFLDGSGESLRDRKAPIHGWNTAPRTPLAA